MGTFISKLICFKKKKESEHIPRVDYYKFIKDSEKKIKNNQKLLNNEVYCPYCDELEIPEILKIHSENGEIELKCCKKNKEKKLILKKYYQKIEKSTITKNKCEKEDCEKDIDPEKRYYCLDCEKYLCDEDKIDHDKLKHLIKQRNERTSFCLKHKKETNEYCNTCEEYFCKECFSENHKKWHDNSSKELLEEVEKAKQNIFKKDQKLLKMRKFYELVRLAYDKNKKDVYCQNLSSVAKSIKKEKDKISEKRKKESEKTPEKKKRKKKEKDKENYQFYYDLAIYRKNHSKIEVKAS